MGFGVKKKKVAEPTVDLEVPVEEVEQPEAVPEIKPKAAPVKKVAPAPAPAPVVEAEPEPTPVVEKPVEPVAQIVDGQVIDGGLIRYTLIANKPIGHIGEILPLDD